MTAVIFHRLGPYHFARLRVASRFLEIMAVETSGADETYAWDLMAGTDGFERITLFENADAQRQPACEVARRMASALDRLHPDVVVVPGWADSAALAALQWCANNRVPAVVMSESTAWDETRNAWREMVKRAVVGLFSAGLAGGTPHAEYLTQLGLKRDRIFLGYDAVDNEYFTRRVQEIRSQMSEEVGNGRPSSLLGIPSRPFFLASNRFVEKKNLSRLIRAYDHYRELEARRQAPSAKHEPWELVILGDGEMRESLGVLRSTHGLDTCVHMPGFKQYPDLPEYYARAGAFIHASTTEQWGLVVNEAMASGLPVLVSNRCGCVRDLVQDGVNGFSFDPYNIEEMGELMLKISDFSEASLLEFSTASQKIISNWSPERFAAGLQAACEKALEIGSIKPTIIKRMILNALLSR